MGNIVSVSIPCDTIVSRCWDSIFGKEPYARKLQENLRSLTTSLQELRALKNDVERRVEIAELQPQLKRLEQVRNWISRVENFETEVNEVVSHSTLEIEKLCCGGYCSKNYWSSYKYGKIVAKKLVEVTDLKSGGVFEEVAAESLPPSLIDERPIERTVGMESMLAEVWNYIEDREVGIIGLYGMGGVGKTTLLTQINNKFLQTPNDVEFVIWIVVSQGHKVENIQDKIGQKIGLSNDDQWKKKEVRQKAEAIFRVLRRKKFVLLLDDIWERVEINEVGVPVPGNQNHSKIIFTTRSEDVCGLMDAQKKIKVKCLAPVQAWSLFAEKVGNETLQKHPDILELARAVANECDGLPIALITVARAMACKKTPQEWRHATQVLQRCAAEFSGMGDRVFPLLKFSYDSLPSKKVKSCFLYCALFPEDFVISKKDLLYSWMVEGFLDEQANTDEAQNESYHIIGILLNACLLEDDEGDSVKMHDVVREMALWLACDPTKTNERFLVHTGDNRARNAETWRNMKRVSLMGRRIESLDETPRCPDLLTSFLRSCSLNRIPDGFFDFMPNLRVLDLSENKDITTLPSGVSNLVSLQHLNLSRTDIRELPIELKALISLRYLNLEFTRRLVSVPPDMISSFPKLKVLRIYYCASSEGILFGGDGDGLQDLPLHLDVLTLSAASISGFQKFFSYHVVVTNTRSLSLRNVENAPSRLDISSVADMKHLDTLDICNYPKLEQLEVCWAGRVPNDDPRNSVMTNQICFFGLQSVSVAGCGSLKDMTWLIFAPNLLHLEIQTCDKMEKIIDFERLGGVADVLKELNPFAKLTVLHLLFLGNVKSIYDSALPFPYLNKIEVINCPKLKKLPLNFTSARNCNLIIKGDESWWNALAWEDEVARNIFLPCFRLGHDIK